MTRKRGSTIGRDTGLLSGCRFIRSSETLSDIPIRQTRFSSLRRITKRLGIPATSVCRVGLRRVFAVGSLAESAEQKTNYPLTRSDGAGIAIIVPSKNAIPAPWNFHGIVFIFYCSHSKEVPMRSAKITFSAAAVLALSSLSAFAQLPLRLLR